MDNFSQVNLVPTPARVYMTDMREQSLPLDIEVYDFANRRLYAKTKDTPFALFEDELSPEELIAIAGDIARRRATTRNSGESVSQ